MTHRVGNLRVIAPPPSSTPSPSPTPLSSNDPPSSPPHPPPTTTATTTTSCHSAPSASSPQISSAPSDSTHALDATLLQTKAREIPIGKNLRWTAVALAAKLSTEQERPSAAVADEIALTASQDLQRTNPSRDAAAVERNTRRRVYDALKVMVAAGCIQREGKALRWIGVEDLRQGGTPDHQRPHAARLRVTICEVRRLLARKRAMQRDLQSRIDAFERLVKRRADEVAAGLPSPPGRIHFPMVLVKARSPQVSYTPGRRLVRVTASKIFGLYSESDIVAMLSQRRRPRGQAPAKKPRVAKRTRPSSTSKTDVRKVAISPVSPPPPPPPSPMVVNINPASRKPFRVSGNAQTHVIDLTQLNVLTETKQEDEEQALPVADDTDVGDTRENSILDSAKAEMCLDAEMPAPYEQDDEDKYFQDLRNKNTLPANIFMHDISLQGEDSENSSSSIGIPDTDFDHLPGNTSPKESFEPPISLMCDEELPECMQVDINSNSELVNDI